MELLIRKSSIPSKLGVQLARTNQEVLKVVNKQVKWGSPCPDLTLYTNL